MHETSLIPDLLQKVLSVAQDNDARKILAVDLTIGALAAISPGHLREHFAEAAVGTLAEGVDLRIQVEKDPLSPEAHTILLRAVEIE